MSKALEKKIEKKARNVLKGFLNKVSGPNRPSPENKESFVKEITGAMLKIIKAEVNIRLQEERHRKNE